VAVDVKGWHADTTAMDAVLTLLRYIGEDPHRDGLADTPMRMVKALREMTAGYGMDPAQVLATTFDVAYDEMVVVRAVPFASLCEHHLLPFTGTVTLGYVPQARVVGLSKLARLVDVYAKRLQVQERMTVQLADAMVQHLDPGGVGVVVDAVHSCMAVRGVGKTAPMHTSALRGAMLQAPTRAEFMALAQAH
jgi:GTP cyclohydrolase I